MTAAGPDQTPVLHGVPRLTTWLRERPTRDVTVLIDAGIADTPIVAAVTAALTSPHRRVRPVPLSGGGDIDGVLALGDRLRRTDLVVAVGGGSLLDQAKLGVLLGADPTAGVRLTVPQRSGLIVLPYDDGRGIPLVAVPTTVGTGAEVSAVACLRYATGKRLVMGSVLRPTAAVLDPVATATLPAYLLAEGVLEALFRVVSPYIGDHRGLPGPDRVLETLATALMLLGHRVSRDRAAGRPVGDDDRLRIAELSGRGHALELHRGRDPYAVKGWLIANELSSALGIRKMTAVAALLPPLWRAVTDGESRLGSAARLGRVWSLLRSTDPGGLPADPATGIATLIDRWRISRTVPVDDDQLDAVARHTVHAWGAGLPMLGGLTATDLRALLRGAAAASTYDLAPAA